MRNLDVPPFAVDATSWSPVSPNLARARRLVLGSCIVVLVAVVATVALLTHPWVWVGLALPLIVVVWGLWLIPRQVRAMTYAERDDDFLFRRGVMFRSLSIVPYGRMQYVDISAGPLARHFGIAELELHTAAAGLDVTVPGLPVAEAERLRDKLSNLGQARSAGL